MASEQVSSQFQLIPFAAASISIDFIGRSPAVRDTQIPLSPTIFQVAGDNVLVFSHPSPLHCIYLFRFWQFETPWGERV